MPLPLVAIVGRPNVGKSTLVNRIALEQLAIVDKKPGITRDRNYVQADWAGKTFTVIDTGGLDFAGSLEIVKSIRKQALLAIDEANAIILMVDGLTGPLASDEEIAEVLRSCQKPVLLTVNKIDDIRHEANIYPFYELGLGEPLGISALHGLGIGDLLDKLCTLLPETELIEEEILNIAIVGRPNVGKSSIFNYLAGQERAVVSEIPGTTRDAIDTIIIRNDKKYCFVDTAGFKKRAKIAEAVEYYGTVRTLRALDRAQIALIVIDATEGATEQDQKIASFAASRGCAVLILINKWDLVKKEIYSVSDFTASVKQKLRLLGYAPALTVSALTGQGISKIYALIDALTAQYYKKISTHKLNDFVKQLSEGYVVSKKRKRLKISYASQVRVAPPGFLFFVNHTELVNFIYKRYLENKIRQSFNLEGCPIRLYFRKK